MSIATHTTQIDNERSIVTRWDFRPGEETGVHIHGYDYCVVPLMDGVLRIVTPDGSETMVEMKAGESYFREKGVHHNVINANNFDYAFVEVEFK
ncbi:MAG: cupin domain-containing protein [Pseudomonadota bacterium]